MKSFQRLSELVIETLKEFSLEKRPLTVDSLCNALSGRMELCTLIDCGSSQALDYPLNQIARISLKNDKPSPKVDFSLFRNIRNTLKRALDELEPIARDEGAQRASEVQQHLETCHTMEALAQHGDDFVETIRMNVSRAVEQINIANEFLSELSENLVEMEKELFSYQNHNRETFLLHDKFCDNLLSHTEEMNQAVNASKGLEETRNFISSRLSVIGKAIEIKRKEDEIRLREADSKIAELQTSVRNYNEEILEVTERANALEKEILLDSLMEIHNRRAYDIQIRETLRNYHCTGQTFSLLLIDVDHFKVINDKYGHRAGDKCLQEIAKLVGASLRSTDFLARYGGEELVVILEAACAYDAQKAAEKIRATIDKTRFYYQDEVIPLTISLGVTEVVSTDTEPEMPFVRVDEAMYQAKRGGRNKVCVS